jgi:hypothetical protein
MSISYSTAVERQSDIARRAAQMLGHPVGSSLGFDRQRDEWVVFLTVTGDLLPTQANALVTLRDAYGIDVRWEDGFEPARLAVG